MLTGSWNYQLDDSMFNEIGGQANISFTIKSDPINNAIAKSFAFERFVKRSEHIRNFTTI